LFIFFVMQTPLKAQFTETKERKRMWKKSLRKHKPREAFNPYLDKSKKDKPSRKLARQNERDRKKQEKSYRKQRKINKNKNDVLRPKKKKR